MSEEKGASSKAPRSCWTKFCENPWQASVNITNFPKKWKHNVKFPLFRVYVKRMWQCVKKILWNFNLKMLLGVVTENWHNLHASIGCFWQKTTMKDSLAFLNGLRLTFGQPLYGWVVHSNKMIVFFEKNACSLDKIKTSMCLIVNIVRKWIESRRTKSITLVSRMLNEQMTTNEMHFKKF